MSFFLFFWSNILSKVAGTVLQGGPTFMNLCLQGDSWSNLSNFLCLVTVVMTNNAWLNSKILLIF